MRGGRETGVQDDARSRGRGCLAGDERFGGQGGEVTRRPAESELGDHWGSQLEGSSRQLVWGLELKGEDGAGAKDPGSLHLVRDGLKPQGERHTQRDRAKGEAGGQPRFGVGGMKSCGCRGRCAPAPGPGQRPGQLR